MSGVQGPRALGTPGPGSLFRSPGDPRRDHPRAARQGPRSGVSPLLGHGDYGVRVLIACEFSGIVRDAFIARGHDAISVDLLPSERPGPHLQEDVLGVLERIRGSHSIDLMIAHPPCTYLANSGARWLYGGNGTVRDPERWAAMDAAALFFLRLLEADVGMV